MNWFKQKPIKLPGFCGGRGLSNGDPFLPPDYKMQTDGKKFRFIFPSGAESLAYPSRKYACEIAWHVYNSDQERRSSTWADAQ